jgi:hypothetical protein
MYDEERLFSVQKMREYFVAGCVVTGPTNKYGTILK